MRTVIYSVALGLTLLLLVAGCGPNTARDDGRAEDDRAAGERRPATDSGDNEMGRLDSADIAEPADTSVTPPVAAGPWERAQLRGADFRAIGQEPGWTLAIYDRDSLVLAADYGQRRITTPAPEAVMQDGRTTYHAETEAHTIGVVIESTACSDIMSGEQFEATVTVVLDADSLRGCGRSLK